MRLRFFGATIATIFLLLAFMPAIVHADVNNFTINNLDADYTLGTDDPQGTLAIHEELTVDFADYNHGILRALPKSYNHMPLHLRIGDVSRDGSAEKFTTYTSNGNLVLKIGDAKQTVTGLHHYEINYKARNVLRFVGDKAELNWNVNGMEWSQPFLHITARLHVPATLAGKLTDNKCFTGATGSTSSDCLVDPQSQLITFTTTKPLYGGETLTFNSTVPTAGYFRSPTLADRWDDYGRQILLVSLIPLVALLWSGLAWFRNGRDAKGRGTIVPEYRPVDNLKPAEIDVLLNNKLGKNAVSATIIDLAIRKYLRIEESQSNGVLGIGKHKVYSFVALQTPAAGPLQDFEAMIYNGIFGASAPADVKEAVEELASLVDKQKGFLAKIAKPIVKPKIDGEVRTAEPEVTGKVVQTSDLKNKFYKTLAVVQKSIPKSLASRGYFSSNPASAGNWWHILAAILLFGSFYLLAVNVSFFVGVIIAGIIFAIFGSLMPSRTQKGADAKDNAEGLKLYLNTAEKDRIAMLQSPDAPYGSQTSEPTKTVELFEKLLPYAMVLGVEKQWASQFESIYTTPPDWYNGNWSTFNAVYLADSLNDSMSAMNSSFAAPSSSGSGGSAGGGGGGGGGGGW
jgi:uncharacterized membrane protein YgcG